MAPYLPREGGGGSQYSEGGALYALGLITANHGADMREFLLGAVRTAGNAGGTKPAILHGGCLGLGERRGGGQGAGRGWRGAGCCPEA